MRLIDADKVNPEDVFIGASDFVKDCRAAVIELMNKQPTVDAEIKKMESGFNTNVKLFMVRIQMEIQYLLIKNILSMTNADEKL